jgi:uncharacterized membrane protein
MYKKNNVQRRKRTTTYESSIVQIIALSLVWIKYMSCTEFVKIVLFLYLLRP